MPDMQSQEASRRRRSTKVPPPHCVEVKRTSTSRVDPAFRGFYSILPHIWDISAAADCAVAAVYDRRIVGAHRAPLQRNPRPVIILISMEPIFHVDRLNYGYTHTPVLQGITADFAPSEFVALVGPNGAGKSTFLKVLAGLLRGYKGSVEFYGKPVAELSSRDLARRMAFVPQETHMVFPFTVKDIVMMG